MYNFSDGKHYHILQQNYWQNVILQVILIKMGTYYTVPLPRIASKLSVLIFHCE